ncbi:MAG: hypothetical protein ACI4TS_04725 [Bacteroidaceae bacterium]
MVKMQGVEAGGAGNVVKYMTKAEDDSNAADWLLCYAAFFAYCLNNIISELF